MNEVDKLYEKLNKEANESGYNLNQDIEFTKDLIQGLIKNKKRYGYWSCPCRLASGKKEEDLDIICPCDYRDADLSEFGMCYCSLYVSKDVVDGKVETGPIPERRPEKRTKLKIENKISQELSVPVWRCKVCGYLCAKENPPEICPICKAKKDRFEEFIT